MSDYMIGCKVYHFNGQEIKFYYGENRIGGVTVECMDAIMNRLNNSVEVVRCRDCRYWWKENELCNHEKAMDGNVCCKEANADDYCSFGERTDDECRDSKN